MVAYSYRIKPPKPESKQTSLCFQIFFWPLKMDGWKMRFLCGAKDLYVQGRFGNIGDELIIHTPIV